MGRKLASFLCAGLSRKKKPTSGDAAVSGSPSSGGSHHQFGSSMGVRARGREEEGLWKKTIILGEKCRVPNDEATVYGDNGERVSTYHHRKTSTASSTARNSCSDRRGTRL